MAPVFPANPVGETRTLTRSVPQKIEVSLAAIQACVLVEYDADPQ